MPINKKLIHFERKLDFTGTSGLNNQTTVDSNGNVGNIPYRSIVFIKETNEIWTHGAYYKGTDTIIDTSGFVTIGTELTITGVKHFQNSTDITDLTAGNLIVTGAASVTGAAYAQTPPSDDSSTRLATTEWIRNYVPENVPSSLVTKNFTINDTDYALYTTANSGVNLDSIYLRMPDLCFSIKRKNSEDSSTNYDKLPTQGIFVALNDSSYTGDNLWLTGGAAYDTLVSFGTGYRTIQFKGNNYNDAVLKYRHVLYPDGTNASGSQVLGPWKEFMFKENYPDLVAIEALSGSGLLRRTVNNNTASWTLDDNTYLTSADLDNYAIWKRYASNDASPLSTVNSNLGKFVLAAFNVNNKITDGFNGLTNFPNNRNVILHLLGGTSSYWYQLAFQNDSLYHRYDSTTDGTFIRILDSNNSSVSSSNNDLTLTVKINGVSKSLTNTDTNTATAADNILDGSNSGTEITYAPYASTTAIATWVSNDSNAGKLYLGTVNPAKTTRLNYNGHFYATKLYSGGNEVLTSAALDGYLPLTGGTMTSVSGDNSKTGTINAMHIIPKENNTYSLGSNSYRWNSLFLKGGINYMMTRDSSNAMSPLYITNTDNLLVAEIMYHNTGDRLLLNEENTGAFIITPYIHSGIDAWGGTIGLYIGKHTLKWENNKIIHEGYLGTAPSETDKEYSIYQKDNKLYVRVPWNNGVKKAFINPGDTRSMDEPWFRIATFAKPGSNSQTTLLYITTTWTHYQALVEVVQHASGSYFIHTLKLLRGNLPLENLRLYYGDVNSNSMELWIKVTKSDTTQKSVHTQVLCENKRSLTESNYVTLDTELVTTFTYLNYEPCLFETFTQSSIGANNNPVYFNNSGLPVASSYSFTTAIPANNSDNTTIPTSKAVWDLIKDGISVANSLVFIGTYTGRGSLTAVDTTKFTPTFVSNNVKKGWLWVVSNTTNGEYFSNLKVEVGDFIIANVDNPGTDASKYYLIQKNLDPSLYALKTDLGNYVTINTDQTITGIKTFTNTQIFNLDVHLNGESYITSAHASNLTVNGNASIVGLINLNNGFRIGTKEATSNNSYDAYTYIGPGDATNNNNLRIYLEDNREEGSITFGDRNIAYGVRDQEMTSYNNIRTNIVSYNATIKATNNQNDLTTIAVIAGVPIKARIAKSGENSSDVEFDTLVKNKTINVTGTNPVIGEFNFIDQEVKEIYLNLNRSGSLPEGVTSGSIPTTNFHFCTGESTLTYATVDAAAFIKHGRSADSNVLLADGRDIAINNLLTSRTLTIGGTGYSVYSPNSSTVSLDSVYVRTADVDLDVDGVKTFKKDIILYNGSTPTGKIIYLRGTSIGNGTWDWASYADKLGESACYCIAYCKEKENNEPKWNRVFSLVNGNLYLGDIGVNTVYHTGNLKFNYSQTSTNRKVLKDSNNNLYVNIPTYPTGNVTTALIISKTASGTTHLTSATANTNTYVNLTEGGTVDRSIKITGSSGVTVATSYDSATQSTLTISGPNLSSYLTEITLTGDTVGSGGSSITTTTNALSMYFPTTTEGADPYARPADITITKQDGKLYNFKATSTTTNGKPATDAHILHFAWDGAPYDAQLAIPTAASISSRSMSYRGLNNGNWGDWKVLLDSNNYTSYVTLANLGIKSRNFTIGGQAWTVYSSTNAGVNVDNVYVRLNPGAAELTIESSIGTISKGIVLFYRSSGNHYAFITFANKVNDLPRILGGIGFASESVDKLQFRTANGNYYDIFHANNAKWANLSVSTSTNTKTKPMFGEIQITNSTAGSADTHYCRLIYDATNQCLKFIFV